MRLEKKVLLEQAASMAAQGRVNCRNSSDAGAIATNRHPANQIGGKRGIEI